MYLAIDLGGTKTLIGLFDEHGEVKKAVKFPTSENYQEFLQELKQNVQDLTQGIQLNSACMAIPGMIDRPNGVILRLGNLNWPRDLAIKADLASFINCPIILENDANLAALSEAKLVNDTYTKVLYITISTGIGSGYAINSRLNDVVIDTELGHMLFDYEGELQEWEDFASGSWIVKTFGKRASELDEPEAWKQISNNIALGMVNAVNALSPDVIVIGGGVGTHLNKFQDFLEQAISKIDPGFNKIPPIIQAQRPEEAVIYGCYELATQVDR